MRGVSILFGVFAIFMLSNCGGSQSAYGTQQDKVLVDSLIAKREFRIVNQWALPMMSSSMMKIASSGILGPGNSGQRIDLSGNGNFLEFKGDTVKAFLPYFGERHMGGGYNTDGVGIHFDQVVETIQFDYKNAKDQHIIKFRAKDGAETFELTLFVFSNKKSSLLVSSSQRDMIRYEGNIIALPEKDRP
ncbi:DUF4251 domain-containing protein [Galbibacter sp.]|jgi:hypothetical protein|uniref:DUF4251 domain-containing protein n=1 Tax=Galbibacter sp. TaxID=2918471 RepID=UPI003A94458E